MTEITIPQDLWEENIEGTLLGWLYANGATVESGEPVVEVMVEKVQYEIPAPAGGRLVRLLEEEAMVSRGDVVGRIE